MTLFLLLALVLASFPALAETPQSRAEIDLSFAPLVKEAAPAVVNIYASRKVQQQVNPLMNDPFVQRFFGGAIPGGAMRERVEKSLGSGVVIRADGLIVTNAHVIENADEIEVVLSDRREFPATVLLRDEHADLAVLRIDVGSEKLPFLTLADSDKAEVGDLVLAIGNPFGVGQTVTSGIVSASGRSAEGISEYNEFIQTDAAINPGNSGGALLDMKGRLLAINSAIYSRDGGSLGIGFAIPANTVRNVIEAAETGRKAVHPWIGVDGQPVTPEIAASLGLSRPSGLMIDSVTPDGPADEAKLRQGDILLTLGDRDITDPTSLRARLSSAKAGAALTATIFRAGATQTVEITPVAPPEIPPRDTTRLKGQQPLSGAEVENISPAVIEDLGSLNITHGVVIDDVQQGSPAAVVGFQPGDIILGVNNIKTEDVAHLVRALSHAQQQWKLQFHRGDQTFTLVLGG
jgi:serine protease Do